MLVSYSKAQQPQLESFKFLVVALLVYESQGTLASSVSGMEPRSQPILSFFSLSGLNVSGQGGDDAIGRCCARRKLPELPSSGKGTGDCKAALYLHCRNFHHRNPNQVLLLAGTRLKGLPVWSKSANPVLPQFPCVAEPAARCVWLPGRKAGTAAAHVL